MILFNVVTTVAVAVIAVGWTWSFATARAAITDPTDSAAVAPPITSGIMTSITAADAPTTAFITEAMLEAFIPLRGESGRLRAALRSEGGSVVEELPSGAEVAFAPPGGAPQTGGTRAPARPGVWDIAIKLGNSIKPIADFSVITLKPARDKRLGRIGLYYIGNWPERGLGRGNYAPPSGFIEVTPENQNTLVSDHFRLRDFLPKDQHNVWPKYLVLDTKLVDKLELVLADLLARGVSTRGVRVMSGFRTPQYNSGVGDTRGRASLSRHMYGDAADIYVDNDGNGSMDDINRDGRVDIRDAAFLGQAADRVERKHPSLVGGVGVYKATSAHGPFTHIDTRGYRARW